MDINERTTFAKRLQHARKVLRKMTQAELCRKAGLNNTTVSKFETTTGAFKPSLETMNKLANALNVSVDYLIGLSGNPDPYKKTKEPVTIEKPITNGGTTMHNLELHNFIKTLTDEIEKQITKREEEHPADAIDFMKAKNLINDCYYQFLTQKIEQETKSEDSWKNHATLGMPKNTFHEATENTTTGGKNGQ